MTGTVACSAISRSFANAVGAHHDGVDVAGQDARRVRHRFAAAELHVLARQHHHVAAQLSHGDLEADPRARARLLEQQRERLAGERAGAEPTPPRLKRAAMSSIRAATSCRVEVP